MWLWHFYGCEFSFLGFQLLRSFVTPICANRTNSITGKSTIDEEEEEDDNDDDVDDVDEEEEEIVCHTHLYQQDKFINRQVYSTILKNISHNCTFWKISQKHIAVQDT